MANLQDRMSALEQQFNQKCDWVVSSTLDGVDKLFDLKSFQQGNITAATLRGEVQATCGPVMAEIISTLRRLEEARTMVVPSSEGDRDEAGDQTVNAEGRRWRLHMWGGRFNSVPANWILPNVNVYQGWCLWWLGNPKECIPPFRCISTVDIPQPMKKKFSEWKCLYSKFEEYLARIGKLCSPNPSDTAVQSMYNELAPLLSNVGSKRGRQAQLSVGTFVRKVRKL